ncbi:MAG TPA: NAD(P)H-dependent oxidoreductase [Salinarimonas sp.]|nr:NAD(P)H-dependent oxidoreductase [Salinarimonas sp.]
MNIDQNTQSPSARPAVRLLGISGSLRRDSHCTAVLRTLADRMREGVTLTLHSLEEVPLYNADHDGDQAPGAVKSFKSAISMADGLVICSPEYNYGMPGVLKNAIDWASRPAFKSPLVDKPVLIMTASPGTAGGVRAQYQVREALSATLARPISRPQVAIASVAQKVSEGRLADAATLEFVDAAVADLLREIAMLRTAHPGR